MKNGPFVAGGQLDFLEEAKSANDNEMARSIAVEECLLLALLRPS